MISKFKLTECLLQALSCSKGIMFRVHITNWLFYYRSLMQFCFMSVIQKELDQYEEDWNNHRVRRQVQLRVPTGIPNILFTFPERYGESRHESTTRYRDQIDNIFKLFFTLSLN